MAERDDALAGPALLAALAGASVRLDGRFDAGSPEALRPLLARLGAREVASAPSPPAHAAAPALWLVGAHARRLRALLGTPAPTLSYARWSHEDALDDALRAAHGLGLRTLVEAPERLARPPAPQPPRAVFTLDDEARARNALARAPSLAAVEALARDALRAPAAVERDALAAALLADPRLADGALRGALVDALDEAPGARSLAAFADALAAHHRARTAVASAPAAPPEAHALGRLVARGVTRWHTPRAPFALEYPLPSEAAPASATRRALEALARRAGPVETLLAPLGGRLARVRLATLPGGAAPSAETLVELFAAAAARRRARVWLAGLALPAGLSRATWHAVLTHLGA